MMAAHKIKTRNGEESVVPEDDIRKFKERLRGALVLPADTGYDEARKVYNAMHDKRPGLIVQAAGVADVIATAGWSSISVA